MTPDFEKLPQGGTLSEFTDRRGRILTGEDRRFAYRMDGLTSREIRKGERIERRAESALDQVPLVCRSCDEVRSCRFGYDPVACGEEEA